jgi:hypothetical protein
MRHGVGSLCVLLPVIDITPPSAAPYEIIIEDGRVFDIDKDDLDRW